MGMFKRQSGCLPDSTPLAWEKSEGCKVKCLQCGQGSCSAGHQISEAEQRATLEIGSGCGAVDIQKFEQINLAPLPRKLAFVGRVDGGSLCHDLLFKEQTLKHVNEHTVYTGVFYGSI
jgi:hypothetical protein